MYNLHFGEITDVFLQIEITGTDLEPAVINFEFPNQIDTTGITAPVFERVNPIERKLFAQLLLETVENILVFQFRKSESLLRTFEEFKLLFLHVARTVKRRFHALRR